MSVPTWLAGLLDDLLEREGWPAYTDKPADRGGPTKGGITLVTLQDWHRRRGLPPATAAHVRALTEAQVREIYVDRYVVAPGFDRIVDSLLRHQLVDAGVLHGTERATKWLQEVAGVKVDGRLGPITETRVNSLSPHALGVRFASRRIRFFGEILSNEATQTKGDPDSVWAKGWLNRATSFLDAEVVRFLGLRSAGG